LPPISSTLRSRRLTTVCRTLFQKSRGAHPFCSGFRTSWYLPTRGTCSLKHSCVTQPSLTYLKPWHHVLSGAIYATTLWGRRRCFHCLNVEQRRRLRAMETEISTRKIAVSCTVSFPLTISGNNAHIISQEILLISQPVNRPRHKHYFNGIGIFYYSDTIFSVCLLSNNTLHFQLSNFLDS